MMRGPGAGQSLLAGLAGLALGIPFFGLFAAGGTYLLYTAVLRPYHQARAARQWTQTECTILRSELVVSQSSEGASHRAELDYEYAAGGQLHRSDRVRFGIELFSFSARDTPQQLVDAYPPGRTVRCWFDPGAPTQAVLRRDAPPFPWTALLFCVPFLTVGYGGVGYTTYAVVRRVRRGASGESAPARPRPYLPAVRRLRDGRLQLREDRTLGQGVPIALALNLFWNGMVAMFLSLAISLGGGTALCIGLFMLPFALVGLGMLYGLLRSVATSLGPQPVVRAGRETVQPGATLQVDVGVRARLRAATRLRVVLEGREEATYMQGTTTTTDTARFYERELLAGPAPRAGALVSVPVTVPPDAMHSFEDEHNAIRWSLVVSTPDVWPAAERRFAVAVLPAGLEPPQ